jgi:hypothetical protein
MTTKKMKHGADCPSKITRQHCVAASIISTQDILSLNGKISKIENSSNQNIKKPIDAIDAKSLFLIVYRSILPVIGTCMYIS